MLMRGLVAIAEAAGSHRALPAFSVYNLEMAQAIATAGERTGLPVIMIAGSSAFLQSGRHELARLALDVAASSRMPVGIHLDHSRSLEEIFACLDMGYTSVMFDGSHLSFSENVRWTTKVVERAHDVGAWVEAELVGISGDEDVSTNAVSDAMTDPALAEEFVAATGVDALAVAIGNVHGWTSSPPVLDFDRLEEIGCRVDVPLVLHGASGLPRDAVLACLDRGVAKVNVNAELRRAFLGAVDEVLPWALEGNDLVAILEAGRTAVTEVATEILRLLDRSE